MLVNQKLQMIERHMTSFWKDWAITFIRINKTVGGLGPLYPETPKEITRGIKLNITIHC